MNPSESANIGNAKLLGAEHPLTSGTTAGSSLIKNYSGQRTSTAPVWFMRQAGRSLPEYRAIRANNQMLEACLTPDLVTEITIQPIRRHSVDAAIFFSDIVVPLKLAGIGVDIVPGVGPVMESPVRTWKVFEQIKSRKLENLHVIQQAVTQTAAELDQTPLIAFGGAPFTLASYLIEGGPSKSLPVCRNMMATDPALFRSILEYCADITSEFIRAQVVAGASAYQLFDSWAGKLSLSEYETFAADASRSIFTSLGDLEVPAVHYGLGTKSLLSSMHSVGATVMGIDHLTTIGEAYSALADESGSCQVPMQGNINPDLLAGDWDVLEAHARQVIADGLPLAGHVLNLGHGVPPTTDPDVLTRLVDLCHSVEVEV